MKVAEALADAAVEAALAAPVAYLPSVRVQVEYAQRMVHKLMAWAEKQEQSLEDLARGGALKAAALALTPLPDDHIVARIDDYSAAMHLAEVQLRDRERETGTYRCSQCDLTGFKLWRQYNTFADHIELLCASCAERDQNAEWNPARGDQIGGLVPAVPTADGAAYWGYTSVPSEGVHWWHSLCDRKCPSCDDTGVDLISDMPCDCPAGDAYAEGREL